MFYVLLDCTDPGFLKTVLFVKNVIRVLQIGVPIILILFCLLDAVRNVASSTGLDSKIMKKMAFRIVAAIAIFLVPSFINIMLAALSQSPFQLSECWVNATEEYIENAEGTQRDGENVDIIDRSEEILRSLELRKRLFSDG